MSGETSRQERLGVCASYWQQCVELIPNFLAVNLTQSGLT